MSDSRKYQLEWMPLGPFALKKTSARQKQKLHFFKLHSTIKRQNKDGSEKMERKTKQARIKKEKYAAQQKLMKIGREQKTGKIEQNKNEKPKNRLK